MSIELCIPVISNEDLEKSLLFWSNGLGFDVEPYGYDGDKMIGCMLNTRDGFSIKPIDLRRNKVLLGSNRYFRTEESFEKSRFRCVRNCTARLWLV